MSSRRVGRTEILLGDGLTAFHSPMHLDDRYQESIFGGAVASWFTGFSILAGLVWQTSGEQVLREGFECTLRCSHPIRSGDSVHVVYGEPVHGSGSVELRSHDDRVVQTCVTSRVAEAAPLVREDGGWVESGGRVLGEAEAVLYGVLSGETPEDIIDPPRSLYGGKRPIPQMLVLGAVNGLINRSPSPEGRRLGFLGIEGWRCLAVAPVDSRILCRSRVLELRPTKTARRSLMKREVVAYAQGEPVQHGIFVSLVEENE